MQTTKIEKLKGYGEIGHDFVAVTKNAYVQCTPEGNIIFDRGEVEIAKMFAAEFPNLQIIVSIGPYRFYDIAGEFNHDHTAILLDIYSVRVPSLRDSYITELISNAHRILAKPKN